MAALADLLPLLWILGACGLLILMIRLNRRVSQGSRTAGPRQAPKPEPVGLTATPWELDAIDLQLNAPLRSLARKDLVATVNRLIAASRDQAELVPLPLTASNADIDRVVTELESKLDLNAEPTTPSASTALAVDRTGR